MVREKGLLVSVACEAAQAEMYATFSQPVSALIVILFVLSCPFSYVLPIIRSF